MDKPLVSIIVAAYNVEAYISECLDSIIVQEYDNFELICVEDASNDNTASILESYHERDKRINVIHHTNNSGPSAVRNTGMDSAKGKYILFVDGDDVIAKNLLSETVQCAEKYELDEVVFGYKVFTREKEWKWREKMGTLVNVPKSILTGRQMLVLRDEIVKASNNTIASCTVWTRLYNRLFLVRNNLHFLDGIVYEDALFWFQSCLKSKRVMILGKHLYYYRKSTESITASCHKTRAKSLFTVISLIYAEWIKNSFSSKEDKAIGAILVQLYSAYNKSVLRGETEDLKTNPAVDFAYKFLHGQLPYKYGQLTTKDIVCLSKAGSILVYGAGGAAADVFEQLNRVQLKIMGVMVSHKEGNPESFGGVPVKTLEEWGVVKNAAVIIAVTSKFSAGIEQELRQVGYQQIVTVQEN